MKSVPREPLDKWKYPGKSVLEEDSFAATKPNFAPFPTVTTVINATFCPRAIYHDLLHGESGAMLGSYDPTGAGDIVHRFVEILKSSISNNKIDVAGRGGQYAETIVRTLFYDYIVRERIPLQAATDIWKSHLEPLIRRKINDGDLLRSPREQDSAFEITVANARMQIELDGGVRHYPLTGRIDEIDFTGRRIIERTIKKSETDAPPILKDYQCWLNWRLLCSIPKDLLPAAWRSIDFRVFDLIVETPVRDYVVPKDNPDFTSQAHWAYAWISDIGISDSPGIARETFLNERCSPSEPSLDCSHPFWNCFSRGYPFPEARPEMRRVFDPWYRLLLWERMWQSDLWWYQILMLPKAQLLEKGFMTDVRLLKTEDGKAVLEIPATKRASVRGYDKYTLVTDGTLHCGRRVDAFLKSVEDNRLTLEVPSLATHRSKRALLLQGPADSGSSLVQPPPGFLIEHTQRGLLKLQHAGVIKPDRARSSSVVQLLESVFGVRNLRRGNR